MCGAPLHSDGAHLASVAAGSPVVSQGAKQAPPWREDAAAGKKARTELEVLYETLDRMEKCEGMDSAVRDSVKDRIQTIKQREQETKPQWQILQAAASQLEKVRHGLSQRRKDVAALSAQLEELAEQKSALEDEIASLGVREAELAKMCETKQEAKEPAAEAWIEELPIYADMDAEHKQSAEVQAIKHTIAAQMRQLEELAAKAQAQNEQRGAVPKASPVGSSLPRNGDGASAGGAANVYEERDGDDSMGGDDSRAEGGGSTTPKMEPAPTQGEAEVPPGQDAEAQASHFAELLRKRVGQELTEEAIAEVTKELASSKKPRLG